MTSELDAGRVGAFRQLIGGVLNGATTALGLSVGHRTGLFDTMSGLKPSTSHEVANSSGLNERYVREWLNLMVVSGIVEYDRQTQRYALPAEHAALLTTAAGPDNIAALGQFIPLLGRVEDELLEAFKTGGGIPYSSFPAFVAIMAETSALRFDHSLVDVQIPLVPGIVERLESGIDVADMGCGAGHAINLMAQRWPASRFTGYDFSDEAIAAAREEAQELKLANAQFAVQDVSSIDQVDQFDFITTFDAVHDQADPAGLLSSVWRLFRDGGSYLCADIAASSEVADNVDHPIGPFGYGISLYHCMPVSLAQGGVGLGSMWGEQKALEMLGDAGFADVDVQRVEGDFLNNFYIATKA